MPDCRLRQRILAEKERRRAEISSILAAEAVERFMSELRSPDRETVAVMNDLLRKAAFPVRIKTESSGPGQAFLGRSFDFSTLPVLY